MADIKMSITPPANQPPSEPPARHLHPAERVPSSWILVAEEGSDKVEAKNLATGRIFNGTVAEFNQMLKG